MAETLQLPPIFAFDDPLPAGVDAHRLLGGKGAGLVEMTQHLGMPVPPGFVITTDVCRRYLESGWPSDLDSALEEAMARLGQRLGATYGDPATPLLVSVRSGAPVSMPGMMDTLLNVGTTPQVAVELARSTGDPVFAADCWLRFCRMYGAIVLGLPKEAVEAGPAEDSAPAKFAAAERIEQAARDAGAEIPLDPGAQLRGAIRAVFQSWHSERARLFREREGIDERLGTAVTVQAMVFGNRDDRSGTGVVFTRNPSTGEAAAFGDYLVRAQGEDVVAGTHAVNGLDALRHQLPEVANELDGHLHRLERHYRDMCDVEFTVSAGQLFILQTRVGRRTPLAAVRMAVEMAEDSSFPIDRAEAVARIDQSILAQVSQTVRVREGSRPVAKGLAASPGAGTGMVCTDTDRAAELAREGKAVVLVREDTSPEDVHGMVGAAAIITTRGGVVSHAAVVARSWSIPAVTSLEGARVLPGGFTAGDVFVREGDVVTVDGTDGLVYLDDVRVDGDSDVPWARTIREWAAELGIEPGTRTEPGTRRIDGFVDPFELLRCVQLKGLCPVARAAAYLDAGEDAIIAAVTGASAMYKETSRGLMLTAEGRGAAADGLARERAACGSALEMCYEEFMPLNDRFKRLVTWWQTEGSGTSEDSKGRLLKEIGTLHEAFLPVLAQAGGPVPRLVAYTARFDRALAALRSGDLSMLASPLKESYHTLWFDFHEELIALSGRNRADEE